MGETVEIDLKEFFAILLKRIWLVALCAVLLATSVLVYTVNFVTPQYQASVSIYVNNNSKADGSYISSADLAVALRLVATYVNIIQSDAVLDKVIQETGLLLTTAQVRSMISAEAMGETEMFRVNITSPNAQMSADVANAIANVAPAEISKIIEGSSAKVIDYAKVATSRISPNYTVSAITGVLVGALMASMVIVLSVCLDKQVKSEEELIKICPIPVLGAIPDFTQISKEDEKRGGRRA